MLRNHRRAPLLRMLRVLRALASTTTAVLACCAISPAHAQDLLVGQIASQSNIITSANAKGLYLGMKTYFDFINAQGGINGRQVKIVNKDDDIKPAKMIEMTKEFADNKDVLVLAAYQGTAGLTELAKQDLVAKLGFALVSPLSGDKNIVGAANIFPFRSGYPAEVTALIKEAVSTGKKKVVLVTWNVSFGPAMLAFAQEAAKKEKLNIVKFITMDAKSPDKEPAVVKEAVDATVKEAPDAVMMLIATKYAADYTRQIKNSPAAGAQLYTLSVEPAAELVEAAGVDKARGIIITQAIPFPFSATLPMVFEYQKLMKKYSPDTPLSFSTLEGFAAGKITAEALRRASPNPTREKVLKALLTMGEYDLGGVYVNYSATERRGWGAVDLSVIGTGGKLLR
ncbi:MAG: amino acid/amide transporter substrate-binding protein family [Betaproteobacteria bacterium]|nr:amino acid/amide transporter substrate-binding protein family [Betaproteobacteria bacterium]